MFVTVAMFRKIGYSYGHESFRVNGLSLRLSASSSSFITSEGSKISHKNTKKHKIIHTKYDTKLHISTHIHIIKNKPINRQVAAPCNGTRGEVAMPDTTWPDLRCRFCHGFLKEFFRTAQPLPVLPHPNPIHTTPRHSFPFISLSPLPSRRSPLYPASGSG